MRSEQVRVSVVWFFVAVFICVPISAWAGGESGSAAEEDLDLLARYWPAVSKPHTRVVLSSKLNEYVRELTVEEGDRVSREDVVLRFDARQIEAQIAVATVEADHEARIERQKDRYEHLKREYERSRSLAEGQSVISESEVDQHRTQMQMARLDLAEMERQALAAEERLNLYRARATDYTLKSPIKGVVSQVWIEEGEMAREGEKLIEIMDPEEVEIRMHMSEKLAAAIYQNQQASVQFACIGGETVPASVYFVSPYVDSSSGTFLVKLLARAELPELKPGMGCKVRFVPRKEVRAETAAASSK